MEEIITCRGCDKTFYKHLLYMDGLCIKCSKKQTVTHVRTVLRSCSKCNRLVDMAGLFQIGDKEMCGTCVGKHFEEDLKKYKEKDTRKEKRNKKERRIILD